MYWRLPLERVRRRKLRLGICTVVVFVIYILVFKAEMEQSPGSQDDQPSKDGNKLYYTSPNYPSLRGRPFGVSNSMLKELRLLPQEFASLTNVTLQQFVFATAASIAFFDMVKETVTSVQKHRPQNQIYVYDLGLTQMQAHEVQSMCGVIYRKFGFSLFPKHVRKKVNYAWKPIIIADVLTRHPGVFWMDSSVRLVSGDFSALFQQIREASGGLALTTTGHSTYAATHPDMFKYLPSGNPAALKQEEQREATLFIYKTEDMVSQVVRWMVLCALDERCIAPRKARQGCVWRSRDHFSQYGGCHRYDQSAFNILMMNYIKGKSSSGYYGLSKVCEVQRYATGRTMPKYCGGDKSKEDLEIKE